MSSVQAIHNQLNNIKHVVICVNPIDLDNIWQSLWALKLTDILHLIKKLIKLFKGLIAGTQSLVLGGGFIYGDGPPFGRDGPRPLAIVAIARTWYADVNIFRNNYNDLVDLDAAMEIENIVKKRAIPPTLAKMHMFDALTVVPLAFPSSLPYRRAVSCWDEVYGQRVIRIKEAADGPINVFYSDEEAMVISKQMAIKEISYTLSLISEKQVYSGFITI
ncbi:hypothetical protein DL770_010026 [Monosporascus sp. CRB-9-2]|nr:hypothetical protein DL770_010026 [Monosporascus sp. CRB-9-2]